MTPTVSRQYLSEQQFPMQEVQLQSFGLGIAMVSYG